MKTVVAVDPLNLSGTVDTARVSDGSLVEIFSDDADEGQAKIAETMVAGGAFSARAWADCRPWPTSTPR
ncbi:MAG TPA: hypothetical protein VMS21_01575 [Methylomirabilota bacterium]|nr:hypothetical protein [Methylomirabilota bacterium]